MSRISKAVKKEDVRRREDKELRTSEIVENFMGGESYKINPINTLRMIAASSIFGEASYYRSNVHDGLFKYHEDFSDDFADTYFSSFDGKTTTQIFEEAIDDALSYDFGKTLELAVTLRTVYNMRLNPQVIMVRASMHKDRAKWSEQNAGEFARINKLVMSRADEPATQVAYYMYSNKSKANMPSILKRSIANKLSGLNKYQVNKYKNAEIGMIDTARIVHASSDVLNELMKTGTVKIEDTSEMTWEQKRSNGMSWGEIIKTTNMGHMAMLRNLRNVFKEVDDPEVCRVYLEKLKSGVLDGKQFPFRYYSAYQAVKNAGSDIHFEALILDCLEECIDISIANMPKLPGKTMCLSDNSASAWGDFRSEYGTVTVAHIDNLSSVIAAMASDEGYVGKFGDKLKKFPISKRNGALKQAEEISANGSNDVGGATEGGIWEFFNNAIKNKEHFDNIFIFSDEQAGTGGLYGTSKQEKEYKKEYGVHNIYRERINVYKLVKEYRKVNPNVNVFSVQTAGYNNVLLPEMSYRTALLTGWTGKEMMFAEDYINIWNDIEGKNNNQK